MDVALHVPAPAPDGVKTPACVMVPPVAVHVTPVLKAPVPATFAEHVEVCAVVIADGFAATIIPVTVAGALVMVIAAAPEMFVKPDCVEFAMQLPAPVPDGVKTPACVMVPPVAVHVTPVPNAPVPATVATQVEVCDEVMLEGFATTLTLVTVGAAFDVVIAVAPEIFV